MYRISTWQVAIVRYTITIHTHNNIQYVPDKVAERDHGDDEQGEEDKQQDKVTHRKHLTKLCIEICTSALRLPYNLYP